MLDDPARAVVAAGLLVRGGREEHVAAEAGDRVAGRVAPRRARLRGEEPDHAELERDHVLHVDRAASVDVAVGDLPVERVVCPLVEWRRHHVEVRQQEERFAARAVAPEANVHGAATGDRLHDFGAQTNVIEGARDVPRRPKLTVARRRWRVHRWDPDQVAERLDELVSRVRPVVRRDGVRRPGGGRHEPDPVMRLAMMPRTNPAVTITMTMITSNRP